MSGLRAHISFPALQPLVRRSAVAALGAGVIVLAGCGGGPLEVEPVREDEPDAVIADLPDQADPAELAEASAVLQKVPGGGATPVGGGILFGGRGGGDGESFGFASGPPASSGGLGFGSSDGGGRGETFGSSNADATAGDAAGAAAAAGSGLIGSGRDTAERAAGAALGGQGESFGFRSDGGGDGGSFGFRGDGSTPPTSATGPAPGSATDTTPGAVVAAPGATLPGGGGNSFGFRVDQRRTTPPRSFGYAGPPRPEDQTPEPTAGVPGVPPPTNTGSAPPGTVRVIVSGIPVDTPLPPASRTPPAP